MKRFFGLCCVLLLITPVSADKRHDDTVQDLKARNHFVENSLRNLPHYRHRSLDVVTSTDRGGFIEGYWSGNALRVLTFDVWVSNKNYTTRYVLQSHRIVAIDDITEMFNPIEQKYYNPREIVQERYLFDNSRNLYKANASGTRFKKPTAKESANIDFDVRLFPKLEKILIANKKDADLTETVRTGKI